MNPNPTKKHLFRWCRAISLFLIPLLPLSLLLQLLLSSKEADPPMYDNLKEMTEYLKKTSKPSSFSSLNFFYSQAPNHNYTTLYAEFKGSKVIKQLPFSLIPSSLDFNSLTPNNFPNLTEIQLVNTSISYIHNISNLSQILHLHLSSNSLLNTFNLSNIIALKTLDLSNNPNLQGTLNLSNLVNLSQLNISNTKISSLLLNLKYSPSPNTPDHGNKCPPFPAYLAYSGSYEIITYLGNTVLDFPKLLRAFKTEFKNNLSKIDGILTLYDSSENKLKVDFETSPIPTLFKQYIFYTNPENQVWDFSPITSKELPKFNFLVLDSLGLAQIKGLDNITTLQKLILHNNNFTSLDLRFQTSLTYLSLVNPHWLPGPIPPSNPDLSEIFLNSRYRPDQGDGHKPKDLELYASTNQISKIKYIDTLTSHTLTTFITPSWAQTS